MVDLIKKKIQQLRNDRDISELVFRQANSIYFKGQCQLLTQSQKKYEFTVNDEYDDYDVAIHFDKNIIFASINKKENIWNHLSIAALMQLSDELNRLTDSKKVVGKKYTREGMIKRVMEERFDKSLKSDYKIEFADNIYGEHLLVNERGIKYKITLRDFDNETGYIDCMDLQTNKLGTTKHIMFAFRELKSRKRLFEKLEKRYPFVEVYLDPLNEYKITWYYPHKLDFKIEKLLSKYFGESHVFPEDRLTEFLGFMQEGATYKQILIRPEVYEKVEKAFNRKILEDIQKDNKVDFSLIKGELFSYQKEGVEFAVFKEGAIIADEMGLGKTLQAIAIAINKKKIFDFKHTLIVCPASLKQQWKSEIEKFSDEKAIIVEGLPENREKLYKTKDAYFLIVNYETILRDSAVINKQQIDFIILDEAQRIKNYTTKTANSIKSLNKNHSLVITGTPIENRLIDLFSIVGFIDPYFLAPLWEFSYQHCYFDPSQKNKITGYYNLQELKERLKSILLRREKRNVMKQLPNISELDIPVEMHPRQAQYHASYGKGIASILNKKFITPFDMQKLMLLLSKMRMVCDSTNLVDNETNFSPKLEELKYILLEKLDLKNSDRKIIIFSEWVRMNNIIGQMLHQLNIGFAELSGRVPVKHRGTLIKKFEENADCKVFISTEAGGSGLNLQVADTVINFELPWNPAKKNQRIGRIDRIGQRKKNLTVINFITRNSIEEKIASGLTLKQSLFDGVLDTENETDVVDFSNKGRSQFLKQLEGVIDSIREDEEIETKTFEDEESKQELPADEREEKLEAVVAEPEEELNQEGLKSAKETITEPAEQEKAIAEPQHEPQQQMEEMEQVMNQGLGFLSGLYKLSTGKEMSAQDHKIEINKETGEVTMKFKLPLGTS